MNAVLFTILMLAQDGTQGDPYPVPKSRKLVLVFDNSYGTVYQIVACEFLVHNEAGAEVLRWTVAGAEHFSQAEVEWDFPLRDALSGIPNGIYTIRASVTDKDGNQSEWSDPPCWINKKYKDVPGPTNLKPRW